MATTPLCDCANAAGWELEAAWPLSATCKASAQKIYCVGGEPVVPPRSQYVQGGDARVDYLPPSPAIEFVSGGTQASPTVVAFPAGVVQPLTWVNSTCYPVALMVHQYQHVTGLMANTQEVRINNKLVVSGAVSLTLSPGESFTYLTPTVGLQKFSKNQSFTYPLPGLIAPGASVTFTPSVEYYFVNGGPSAFTGIESVSVAMRFWGGNV
jgi:hypothetical protein